MTNELTKLKLEEAHDKLTNIIVNYDLLPEISTIDLFASAMNMAFDLILKDIKDENG